MINLPKFLTCLSVTTLGLVLFAGPVQAETTAAESAYVFNTLLFLMCGFLVMFMAAGFAMLESGMVRAKNVGTICVKNISLYSVAGIMFYLVGYNLLYSIDEGGYLGSLSIWGGDDSALTADTPDFSGGYSTGSDWYFQMVYLSTVHVMKLATKAKIATLITPIN